MGELLVGTCSWTDRALLAGGWYPRGRRDAESRLRYYAEQFPVVEVDSSYYALPSRRNAVLWAERTPPGFRFDVKAFSLLTGHPTRPTALPEDLRDRTSPLPGLLDRIWERFAHAVEPLRLADRLGAVLFQFPPWLAPGPRAEKTLTECAERTAGWPVSVEFRHPAWWRPGQADETRALLSRLGLIAVGVDMAQGLGTSLPPLAPVTTPELAVVRFHGRSPAWGTGSKEDRFRHDYTEAELTAWLPRLRAAAEQVDELHVLFNNCCADAAVRAAETMRRLLTGGGEAGGGGGAGRGAAGP
ncbi:DUF72 domain-containing protein [Streptomyces sp. MA5143a]|uniref:DUF72 domain-containing protein n=1 Tax=Streptomyces sp. MA5143a TaxID=2083010 RepID=UPI000D19CA41|nr:DUF72 domain-containing protein [Streptomyces sp. MA5143a]SPF01871.1 hypothetical protein SMA5143A_2613 [Streptomyces sp. MA5143a]